MIHLQIDERLPPPVETGPIQRAAAAALAHRSDPDQVAVTIVVTGDDCIQSLNRQFMGIDAPTDVLAFPSGEIDPDLQMAYLGDVVISYPRAQAQSARGGHSLQQELELLTVHGILHLLGYDHATPEEKARMWAVQTEILTVLENPLLPEGG